MSYFWESNLYSIFNVINLSDVNLNCESYSNQRKYSEKSMKKQNWLFEALASTKQKKISIHSISLLYVQIEG